MENKNFTNQLKFEGIGKPMAFGDIGIFADLCRTPEAREDIYEALLPDEYKEEDVALVVSNNTRNRYSSDDKGYTSDTDIGNKTLKGLGIGAGIGGSLGVLAVAIAVLGTSLAIPGLGIFIVGSLAAGFAGAAAGATIGGLIGPYWLRIARYRG